MRTISDTAEFDGLVRSSPKPVLVDFFATWCGPCVRIAPVLDALAKEHPQVEFVKVDVDEAQDIAQAQGIRAMPTFKMFKGGAEVGMVRGADEAAIRDLLRQHAGDKWSGMSGGQALGSGAADAGMSDREKRLAALERRGLGGGGGAAPAPAPAPAAEPAPPAAPPPASGGEAGASRAFTSDQDWHRLGDVLQSRGERTSGGGDDEDEALAAAIAASLQAPATRPPGAEPPPGPKYAAQLAQLKEMGFTDETACTLALDAAGGDVATAMGALVG